MKYKFFGILVLMLFSVFLNTNYAGAQIPPDSGAVVDPISVSVNGNQVTVSVTGKLSVRSISPQCFNAPEFSVTYSWNSESAETGTVNITSTAGATLSGAIPINIVPSSVSDGDCFTKAISYTFSGSRIFTGVTAGTHTVTVSVTDNLGESYSRVSGSFTVVASSFTVTATANSGGSISPSSQSQLTTGAPVDITVTPSDGYTTNSLPVFNPSDCSDFTGSFTSTTNYSTGNIGKNCNFTFSFTESAPALSCAVDTATTPAPHYTGAGVKFLASNGVGTYSWSAPGATPSSGTGNQIWPIYSTAGTKTVSVSTPTQSAVNCSVVITTPPPGPINGACSATHYNCSSPAASTNNVGDPSGPWTWICPGSNGGTNASCSEAATASMSGTLTASDCVISAGSASCTTDLNWTTAYPVAISSVTTPTNVTVGTGNNSSAIWQVAYGTRNFYLYNNGVLLAQATATATCTLGTEWVSGVCQATSATQPDLTASAPTQNTAVLNTSKTFSSTISNIGGATTGASFYNSLQVATGANGSGAVSPLTASTPSPMGALGATASATASASYTFTGSVGTRSVRFCADNNTSMVGSIVESNEDNNCSAWTNVTVIATAGTISGYHDAYSGTVPASQCRADGWAVYSSDLGLDVNVRILSDGTQVATGVAGTYRGDLESAGVCTGGTCSYWINLSGLISPGVNHSITAQGQNPANETWTTLSASPKTINCAAPTTGTLTASNCTIASGASSCNSALTWSTTNPIGTSNITSNTPSANTEITTGNSGTNFSASVPYSSRTFFLNNNSVPLVSATATATCATGTSWDESKCAVSAPSCTPTTSFSGSVTPASVSVGGAYNLACNFGVVSGYIGASLGSGSCSWSGWSNGTQANFNCTAGSTPGSFSNSCIISYNATYPYCSRTEAINNLTVTGAGGTVNGACSNPDNHLNQCISGTPTPSPATNGISSWTWTCEGSGLDHTDDDCVESKKKPIFIED